MKGIVVCASGNDLILVLMRSLNGGKENKLVTNHLEKEPRTTWHHLFPNLPKREGAGGAWHRSLPEGKNTLEKGAGRRRTGRNQNRDKVAVCCDVTKHSESQPVLMGPGKGVNWIRFPAGEEFCSGEALGLSPPLLFPVSFF